MLAVRSNERAAAAAAINVRTSSSSRSASRRSSPASRGALYAYNFGSVSADRFDAVTALSLIAFAYAGGITLISGAVFAGLISDRRRSSRTRSTSGSGSTATGSCCSAA